MDFEWFVYVHLNIQYCLQTEVYLLHNKLITMVSSKHWKKICHATTVNIKEMDDIKDSGIIFFSTLNYFDFLA
jgi:hypothetical protein